MKGLILVTGSEGLVGSRYIEISKRKNFLHYPTQIEFDITNPDEVGKILSSYNFSAVVNFAAYTDISRAEEERGNKDGVCWQVNVEGTRNLAEAVAPLKGRIHFIHISTDMVFSGSEDDPGAYKEDHPQETDLNKLTWYGYTKMEAEKVVSSVLGDSASILRITYPVRANFEGKLDFLRKPLALYDQGKLYPIFKNQKISTSFIDEVCQVIDKIIIEGHKGIFHAASSDVTTPYQAISYMLEKTRGVTNVVKPIILEEIIEKNQLPVYRYPKYGGLSVTNTEQKLGMKFRNWRQIVEVLISQGLGKE
jgi:dTDP-4-dehydrorhamnose reductase